MKVLKIIKKIPTIKNDNNNNEAKNSPIFADSSNKSKDSGLYYSTVRPELVEFMQSIGLVQQNMHCYNCDTNMRWTPNKSVDLPHWKCPVCNRKSSIKINLTFEGNECSFRDVLQILLCWLNNEDIGHVSEKLGIKKAVIEEIYQLAGKTVEINIRSNILEWHLGGPGVIVLIDTFPEGCTSGTTVSNKPILCLAELKGVPPTMWFEALERNDENREETTKMNKLKCLEMVQNLIQPGSIVIAGRDSTFCSYDDLSKIQHKFKTLISIEGLARHNSEEQNLSDNLNVIWKEALDVCMEAQFYHHSLVQSFLYCYMWRRKFKNEGYQQLFNEISSFIQ